MAQSPRPQTFNAGSLAGLKSALGPKPISQGTPLEIAVSAIDPDPDQPRQHIPEGTLKSLADSMLVRMPGQDRPVGIIQPIGGRKGADARWILAYGARRRRA